MSLPYEVVDVFTDQPFAGNPLAVVFGAERLDTTQLQAIAREFQLSETVFVLPPSRPGATYRARIFTPVAELPFAGHPSVGAAVTVVRQGCPPRADAAGPAAAGPGAGSHATAGPGAGVGTAEVVQECGAGLLPLAVAGGRATLTGGPPTVGPELPAGPLLAAVGLAEPDLAGPPPRAAGCGLEFPFLPVRPDALARAGVDPVAARAHQVGQVSVFAWDPETRVAQARVFVPGMGVPEDPATGSAALGLGVWLVASGLLPGDGESSYVVRQGIELGRPSRLDGTVTAVAGAAVVATVTGSVVPIARGEITVPPRP